MAALVAGQRVVIVSEDAFDGQRAVVLRPHSWRFLTFWVQTDDPAEPPRWYGSDELEGA